MMYIYNKEDLFGKYVHEQADEALHNDCISEDTRKQVFENYRSNLYTPNYFIWIALLLVTVIAIVFAGLFFLLIFNSSSSNNFAGLFIFMAAITYAILETMVKQKNYYNAGVDNALMLFAAGFFVSIFIAIDTLPVFVSLMAILICVWMAIRFTDSSMAGLAYAALLSFVFLLFDKVGGLAKAMTPFALMIVSATTYLVTTTFEKEKKPLFYHSCFKWVRLLTLVSFYASCNYFIVQTFNEPEYYYDRPSQPVPLGWLFWIFTIAIPPAYLAYGIKKKDLVFIRTGLVLAAVSIVTFRYYYSILPAEIAMLVGGILLAVGSLLLMRYLKTPRYGFVFDQSKRKSKDTRGLEALVLLETMGKKEVHEGHTEFGGGSFGGAGSGGDFNHP